MSDAPRLEPLDESTFETVLCVAAHPDDLEYGTAGAVDKWVRAGKTVTYLLVTRGEAGIDTMAPEQAGPAREQEERDGAAHVGVEVVEFLDGFTDGTVEHGLPLRRAIAREIRIRRPDLLVGMTYADRFAGGFVNQADHRAVGLATVDAKADAGNRWIFPDLLDEGLEPWQVPTADHRRRPRADPLRRRLRPLRRRRRLAGGTRRLPRGARRGLPLAGRPARDDPRRPRRGHRSEVCRGRSPRRLTTSRAQGDRVRRRSTVR